MYEKLPALAIHDELPSYLTHNW